MVSSTSTPRSGYGSHCAPQLITAASLLDGPRVRRLCLELAKILDDEVRTSCFDATIPFSDPSRIAWFTLIENTDDAWVESSTPPVGIGVNDFAKVLRAARLRQPTSLELMHAFADAVANARYWQEPDAEDQLAAEPKVVEALRPIAEIIAASSDTSWWTEPVVRPEQWITARGRPIGFGEAKSLTEWRAETIASEARFRKEIPADPKYNFSGSWWSTPNNWDIPSTTRAINELGPINLYLEEYANTEGKGTGQAYLIADDVPVYEIQGRADWVVLCKRYPLEVTASKRHDWYRTTGQAPTRWVQPDWAAVADSFAGVHLTAAAYLTGAGRALYLDDDTATVIAGFNPDATYWPRGLNEIANPIGNPEQYPALAWD